MVSRANTSKYLLLVSCLGLVSACATMPAPAPRVIGHTTLQTPDGRSVGEGTLTASGDHIAVVLTGHDLPSGPHGLHLHAVGKCEGPAFATAGPHLNPGNHQHGSLNPAGTHLGDLPNLVITSDGTSNGQGTVTFALPGTLADASAALFDADGSAIVVHAGADDYRTDPSGNSGARIACGTITAG